jgi:acetyl-CoA carboxylase biotin carboxyl carrier protein
MDISYIKKIIKLVENSHIDELELEEEGAKIRVARNRHSNNSVPAGNPMPAVPPPIQAPLSVVHQAEQANPVQSSAPPESKHHEIRSPIVGTFYRAPAPDAEPYIEVGQSIKVGTVLCIVEAMKLMNEIESDVEGKIVKILAENGKPVEYNQALFLVEQP